MVIIIHPASIIIGILKIIMVASSILGLKVLKCHISKDNRPSLWKAVIQILSDPHRWVQHEEDQQRQRHHQAVGYRWTTKVIFDDGDGGGDGDDGGSFFIITAVVIVIAFWLLLSILVFVDSARCGNVTVAVSTPLSIWSMLLIRIRLRCRYHQHHNCHHHYILLSPSLWASPTSSS